MLISHPNPRTDALRQYGGAILTVIMAQSVLRPSCHLIRCPHIARRISGKTRDSLYTHKRCHVLCLKQY